MKIKTTYVDKANTNEEVFRRARDEIQRNTMEGKTLKKIVPFIQRYFDSTIKISARIKHMENSNPVKKNTPRPGTLLPWHRPNKRVGRPKHKWVIKTTKDIWERIKRTHPPPLDTQQFDPQADDMQQAIEQAVLRPDLPTAD